jgi:hypothetical protein
MQDTHHFTLMISWKFVNVNSLKSEVHSCTDILVVDIEIEQRKCLLFQAVKKNIPRYSIGKYTGNQIKGKKNQGKFPTRTA